MRATSDDDARLRIARAAFDLIENEVRPFIADGGRLWSKGSRGYPSRLRRMIERLDNTTEPTYATADAILVDFRGCEVEHVYPMKRIVIEIVDPRQADPRSNKKTEPIAGGPATSPEHLIAIADQLFITCWVTKDEHAQLNRAGKSMQWDAPDGDGWARYRLAGITAHPLSATAPPEHG